VTARFSFGLVKRAGRDDSGCSRSAGFQFALPDNGVLIRRLSFTQFVGLLDSMHDVLDEYETNKLNIFLKGESYGEYR